MFLVNTVHHPSFHLRAEKVCSNDAESAKPFKVETGVEPLFGSVLVQSCPPPLPVCVCVCVLIQPLNNQKVLNAPLCVCVSACLCLSE